ncbi:MAG: isoleucine--tRNA ligase [Calditrichaeota bacterium]|nr:MAG: isoleucine--tRNA ligase [Calditrichota bacterium]
MFRELGQKTPVSQLEEDILNFWEKEKVFEKTVELRKEAPWFIFYEGPPTANGKPGIHHVLSRTIKDIILRYKTMCGYYVPRKAGWDTHGLPVEIAVEKELGLTQKNEIEKFGIEKFNQTCKELVNKHIEMEGGWRKLTNRMGFWLDLDNAYITYKNEYIESVWWAIKQIFDKGLIYKDFKIVPQSPTIETPLSSHELSLGYKEVVDPNLFIKVKVVSSPKPSLEDAELLIWTTTPWTLISNVAAAVGEEIDYVLVKNTRTIKEGKNEKKETLKLVLAKARLEVLDGEVEILETFKGKDIVGTQYEQIFDFLPIDREKYPNALTLLPGDFVSTEEGSGIVHMAPAFGQDDYDMSKKFNLPVLQPVTPGGRFNDSVGEFSGRPVKTFTYADGHTEEGVDKDVIIALKKMNKVYRATHDYKHSYPHCWRTDNPVIYYARESWFINSPAYKQEMVELNKTINWQPPEIGSGRFGNWLEEVKEWSLSRDRYWGTPLPIWVSEDGEDMFAIGSIEELMEGLYEHPDGRRVPLKEVDVELDLHRPFVDRVVFEKNGKVYRRTPEIIDVWFDSGAMPFAQFHYPFENQELFKKSFPADFIAEGVDQTRGWFYTLHNIATVLFGKVAFKNIIVNDLILDKYGQKMSKSKGNVVYPFEVIDRYGVDPLRWYLMTVNNPWIPKRFDTKGIEEVYRKFFDTLLNTYSFFALYANIDQFDPTSSPVPFEQRPEIDRWILSRLYSLVGLVKDRLEHYDITQAARPIAEFVLDDVSNWYVRRNRRRFWKSGDSLDKSAAYHTLYEVLLTVSKLCAPFIPFVSEVLYQNLRTADMPLSVHLCDFPELTDEMKHHQNLELEERMATAQKIVRMARALRNEKRIKVRQPLSRLLVSTPSESVRNATMQMADIIKEEINVKEITTIADESQLLIRHVKPNYKQLGPRAGKLMKPLAAQIQELGEKEIAALEESGSLAISVNGETITIHPEDVEIIEEQKGSYAVLKEGNVVIALDTTLTPELEMEGIAREFVNRIQNLRKDSRLEVMDRIVVYYQAPEKIDRAAQAMMDYIKHETLAVDIKNNLPNPQNATEIKIDSETLLVAIEKFEGK